MSPSPGAPGGGRGSSRRPPGRPDDLAVAARESMVPCGRRCKEKSYRDNTTPNRLISLSAPARNRLAIASMFMSVDATKNGFFLLSLSRSLAAGTTVGVFDLSCSGSATLAAGSSCAEQACSRSWSLSSSWSARCACLLLHSCTQARQVARLPTGVAMEVWTVQDMQTTHLLCVCPCRVCANGPENYCLY